MNFSGSLNKDDHTLIFNACDVALFSPINFRRKCHVTRLQVGGATIFLGFTGDATAQTKVKEAEFIKSQISKLIHGQAEWVSFSVVLGDFLRAKKDFKSQ